MSLYSQSTNQQLLWEMINKSPITNTAFPPSNPQSHTLKETWFRNILTTFHQKNPNITTRDQLLQLNRNTLSFMMSELKQQQQQYQEPIHKPEPIPEKIKQSSWQSGPEELLPKNNYSNSEYSRQYDLNEQFANYNGLSTRIEPRANSYNNAYSDRQREYDSMLKGPVQTPVQFEQIEERKIQNIAELTEQYRKLRDLEVPVPVAPPVTIIKTNTDDFLPAPPETPIRLTIHDELNPNMVDLRPISVTNADNLTNNAIPKQSSVKWADEFIVSQLSEINQKLDKLFNILLSNKVMEKERIDIDINENKNIQEGKEEEKNTYTMHYSPDDILEISTNEDITQDIDRIRNVWQQDYDSESPTV